MIAHRHARAAVAIGAITITLLAGCAGTTDEPDGPEPSSSSSAPDPSKLLDDKTALSQSICARLDGTKVAQAVGESEVFDTTANSWGTALPIRDTCRIAVGQDDSATAATFGWSVASIDAAGWKAVKDYWQEVQGQFVDIVSADTGDDAFIVGSTGYALVGDRVVSASYTTPSVKTAQIEDILKQAVDAADPLPDAIGVRADPACAELDDAATAVLDTKPTITRGRTSDELLQCLWGTPDALISLSASARNDRESAEQEVTLLKDFGGTQVDGLGTLAYFSDSPDGTVLRWSTTSGTVVGLTTAVGRQAERGPIVALAEAAADSYQ